MDLSNEHPHVELFYSRHLPGAVPGVLLLPDRFRRPFSLFPSINLVDLQSYLRVIRYDAVRDMGNLPSYQTFERKLVGRIRELHSFSTGRDARGIVWNAARVYEFLPPDHSFERKMSQVKLNTGHIRSWKRFPTVSLGNVSIKPEFFVHVEAPFALSIYHGDKQVATGGFHLVDAPDGRKPVLSINNLQGAKGEFSILKELSGKLGENWRLFVARKLVEHAFQQGLPVQGELPRRFYRDAEFPSKAQYRRQVRQYEQAYRKLGFRKEGGRWIL